MVRIEWTWQNSKYLWFFWITIWLKDLLGSCKTSRAYYQWSQGINESMINVHRHELQYLHCAHVSPSYVSTTLNSTAKDLNHSKSPRNGPIGNCTNWIKLVPYQIGSWRDQIGSTQVIPCLLFDRASAKFLGLAPSCPGSKSWGGTFLQSKAVIFYAKSWEIHRNSNPRVGFESNRICIFVALCNTSNPTKRYKKSPKSKVLELLQFERKLAPDSAMSKLSARSGWRTRKSLCCSTNSFRRRIGGQVGSPWQIQDLWPITSCIHVSCHSFLTQTL